MSETQTDRRGGRDIRSTPKILAAVGGSAAVAAAVVLYQNPNWLLPILRASASTILGVFAFYQALLGIIAYRSRWSGPRTDRFLWVNFAAVGSALALLAIAVWIP